MKVLSGILCAMFVLAPVLTFALPGDAVEVVELKLAKDVADRSPVDASDSFEMGSTVVTWMKLMVREPESTIKVRYSIGGIVTWTSEAITVKKSVAWRTWLRKSFHKAGEWKVEVLDAGDNPIFSSKFTIR